MTEKTEGMKMDFKENKVCGDTHLEESFSADETVYDGRPSDPSGRSEAEIRVYDLLDSLGIRYKRVDHSPAYTMAACEEIDRIFDTLMCKNLFLCNSQKTSFYLLMMPGDKKFKTKDLSKQINSARLSFADEDFMRELLGLAPGAVTVLGLMNDRDKRVRLIIDKELLSDEYIGVHPCVNTSSLKIKTSDVTDKLLKAIGHDYTVVELPRE